MLGGITKDYKHFNIIHPEPHNEEEISDEICLANFDDTTMQYWIRTNLFPNFDPQKFIDPTGANFYSDLVIMDQEKQKIHLFSKQMNVGIHDAEIFDIKLKLKVELATNETIWVNLHLTDIQMAGERTESNYNFNIK